MFIINKIKIISAVILAISTAAAVFSACNNTDDTPVIPDETVIGTQGEILGVSYYTVENESETHTYLYEITTKKAKKTKADKNNTESDDSSIIDVESDTKNENKETEKVNKNDTVSEKDNSKASEQNNPQTDKSDNKKTTVKKDETQTKPKHVPIPYVKPTDKPTTKAKATTTVKQTKAETKKASGGSSDETVPEKADGINVVFKTDSVQKGDTASIMIQGTPGKTYTIEFYENSTKIADYSDLQKQKADENGFVTWTFRVPMNCESGNRKIVVREEKSDKYVQTSIKVK